MCVEESVHIIFDETNFATSEQDLNNIKIGLANLEDDEDTTKQQDQRIEGEQQIHEETEESDQDQEQPVNQDQQTVPNPAAPTNEQTDQTEAEQNNNQNNNPEPSTVPSREFVPKPWKYQKYHPLDSIISDLNKGTQTRSQMRISVHTLHSYHHLNPKITKKPQEIPNGL